jgi:hypothetical protein
MAISNVSATFSVGISYQAQGAAPGSQYQPTTAQGNPKKNIAFKTGTTTAGQVNEIASKIFAIAASGTTTISLQSLTDVLGQTVNLVRVKGLLFQLLSTADDSVNGTACSGVTLNATPPSHPFLGFLGGTNPTITLGNGEALAWLSPSANGTGVSGSAYQIEVTNLDSTNAAAFQVTILGADS